MKVTYDPEVDVLRILLSDAPIEESDEDKPGVDPRLRQGWQRCGPRGPGGLEANRQSPISGVRGDGLSPPGPMVLSRSDRDGRVGRCRD